MAEDGIGFIRVPGMFKLLRILRWSRYGLA